MKSFLQSNTFVIFFLLFCSSGIAQPNVLIIQLYEEDLARLEEEKILFELKNLPGIININAVTNFHEEEIKRKKTFQSNIYTYYSVNYRGNVIDVKHLSHQKSEYDLFSAVVMGLLLNRFL